MEAPLSPQSRADVQHRAIHVREYLDKSRGMTHAREGASFTIALVRPGHNSKLGSRNGCKRQARRGEENGMENKTGLAYLIDLSYRLS